MNPNDKEGGCPGNATDRQRPSDSVTFIDVLFAVVVSLGLSQIMKQTWFNPTSSNFVPAYAFEIFVVLIGYSTLLLSWWGYHRSIRRRRTYEGGRLSVSMFVVDILILVGYWLLLVKFESLLFVLCVLTTIYVLYVCWDCLRARQESETRPDQWRRRGVTVLWALFLLIALLGYASLKIDSSPPTLTHLAFALWAHVVNFAYRFHKDHHFLARLLDALVLKRS